MSNSQVTLVQDDIDNGLFFINREVSNTVINVGTIWVYDDSVVIALDETGEVIELPYNTPTPKAKKKPRRLKESTITSYAAEPLRRHLERFLRDAFTAENAPYRVDGLDIYKRSANGDFVWFTSTVDDKYIVEYVLREVYALAK